MSVTEETITNQESKLPSTEQVASDAPQLLADTSMQVQNPGQPQYPITDQGQAAIPQISIPQATDESWLSRIIDASRAVIAPMTSKPQMFMQMLEQDLERKRLARAGMQATAIQTLYLQGIQSGDPAQMAEVSKALSGIKNLEPEANSALQKAQLQMADDLMKARDKRLGIEQEKAERDRIAQIITKNATTPQAKMAAELLQGTNAKITDLDNIMKLMPPQPTRVELKDLSQGMKESIAQRAKHFGLTIGEALDKYNVGDPAIFPVVAGAIAAPKSEVTNEFLQKMELAGVRTHGRRYLDEYSEQDFTKVRNYEEQRAFQNRLALVQAVQSGQGSEPIKAAASSYRYKDSLETVFPGMKYDELSRLINEGQVISGLSQQEVTNIRNVPGSIDTVKQLMDLINKNENIFPSVEKRGASVAYILTGWNRLRDAAGADAVDTTLAELKSMRAKLVPLIKAFGDTGNVAVREAEMAAEGLGLKPTSKESAMVTAKSILRGLVAGVRAKQVNPKWLDGADRLLSGESGTIKTLPKGVVR